jgi:HEAT repeat protein
VTSPSPRILVVEDEEAMVTGLEYALSREGCALTVARDGEAALARVQARLGRAPAGDDVPPAVAARIESLVAALSSTDPETLKGATRDLADFGAAAVPALRHALVTAPREAGGGGRSTRYAAQALAAMDHASAAAILEAALHSPDPIVRSAVTDSLTVERHRALLEKAAADPVARIRERALRTLAVVDDPALLPLMREGARRGLDECAGWLAGRAASVLAEVVADRGATKEARARALARFGDAGGEGAPNDRRKVEVALGALEGETDEALCVAALKVIRRTDAGALLRDGGGAALIARAEAAALARYDTVVSVMREAREVLVALGGLATVEATCERDDRVVHYRGLRVAVPFEPALDRTGADDLPRLAALILRATPQNGRRVCEPIGVIAGAGGAPLAKTLALHATLEGAPRHRLAAAILSAFPGRRAEERRPLAGLIREGLASDAGEVRKSAAQAARRLADPALLPDVVRALGGPDEGSLDEIVDAFRCLAEEDPGRAEKLVEEVFLAAAGDPKRLHGAHMRALERLPGGRGVDLAERLAPRFSDPAVRPWLDRYVTNHFFLHRGAPEAVSAWARIEDRHWRASAIVKFAEALHEPALPILREALSDPDPTVRNQAQLALKAFQAHREALAEAERWLSGDKEQRETVAELVKLLEEATTADQAAGAAEALGALRARAALPALVRALGRWSAPSPDHAKAREVIRAAIRRIGGEGSAAPAKEATASPAGASGGAGSSEGRGAER